MPGSTVVGLPAICLLILSCLVTRKQKPREVDIRCKCWASNSRYHFDVQLFVFENSSYKFNVMFGDNLSAINIDQTYRRTANLADCWHTPVAEDATDKLVTPLTRNGESMNFHFLSKS